MTLPEQRSARTIEPWEPLRDIENVANRMRHMLEETFGNLPAGITDLATWSPPVDIEETDEAYIVEAEVPGVKKKDLNIEIMGNELTISGEIKERKREGVVRRRTRKAGSFFYRVVLPENVDADNMRADIQNGVLTVRLPKSQRMLRRRIEAQSRNGDGDGDGSSPQ
jgi:HSP20 family protein